MERDNPMTDWTALDSQRLDREILRHYPNRQPLRYDPAIAALIQDPDHTGVPDDAATCIDCQRPIWRSRDAGNGRCPTCRHRHKTGAKPRKLRIPTHVAADDVRVLTDKGMSAAAIAAIYNVTPRTIQRLRAQPHQEDEQATA
jgi:DNA-directed RNA polymerase subunit RPC12/RpoP